MKCKNNLLFDFEKNEKKKFVCKRPFELVEFDLEGNIYFCFPRCNESSFKIGNLYKNTYEDISLSKNAIEFKNDILNSEYKYCDFQNCSAPVSSLHLDVEDKEKLLKVTYPKELRLHIDNVCNIRCVMCRNEHIVKFSKEKEFLEIVIPRILSMCRNAEIIFMNGQGEVFFSPLAKALIVALTQNYPNIKFDFCTNALCFNEQKVKEYNLENKIKNLSVSMHANTKDTYNKIVKGGNFDELMKNMHYIKSLKDANIVESVSVNFVVTSYNYMEMIEFLKFAISNDYTCFFSTLVDTNTFGNDYSNIALKNKKQKDYKEFCKILVSDIFDSVHCILDNQLSELRNDLKKVASRKTIWLQIKECLNRIFY